MISTLFLLMNHCGKSDCLQPSLFNRDRLMFCKPGILIFIFAENNYHVRQYICPHHVDENTFAPSELGSPCLSFFLSLSLSLWLIPWNAKAGCITQGILASFLLSLSHRWLRTTRLRSIKGPTFHNKRSPCRATKSSPHSPQLERAQTRQRRPSAAK